MMYSHLNTVYKSTKDSIYDFYVTNDKYQLLLIIDFRYDNYKQTTLLKIYYSMHKE